MSTQRLIATEKDLEKFIRFLALKSIQVVVQSRLGAKIQTDCVALSGNDWFSLVVDDYPDIHAESRKVIDITPGESILKRMPLCVEISLKTTEGDQMILEVWSLDVQTISSNKLKDTNEKGQYQNINSTASEQPCIRGSHTIYNRLGMLLKSLISLTRATPAYKLSRHQSPDSYQFYYRIYTGRPQTHLLGEGHKHIRIGQLRTIIGNTIMSAAYRTKMTISPTDSQKARETNAIMIDSNYFKYTGTGSKPNGGGLNGKRGFQNGERKVIDIEKPLKPGAFTDLGRLRNYTEDDYVLPETPPFEWLLRKPRHESGDSAGTGYGGSIEYLNRKCDSPQTSPFGNGHQNNININNALNNNTLNSNYNANSTNNNSAGFKNLEKDENLQMQPQKSPNDSTRSQSPIKSLFVSQPPIATKKIPNSSAPNLPMTQMLAHQNFDDDESLLKELSFPFACPTSHVNDLAKFYRDCHHAPPLKGFSELQDDICSTTAQNSSETKATCSTTQFTNAQTCSAASNATDYSFVDDLSKQLEQFETSLEDYDQLVSQFGILQTSSSTGSRSSGLQMSN